MTETTKRWLSVAGIVLSIVGFYVKNAASYPAVQAIIAPSYINSKAALERIRREGSLAIGAPEFPALATVVEDGIAKLNPTVPRAAIVLEKLEASGGGIAFGRASSRQIVNLQMFFRGQKEPVKGDLLQLENTVEATWSERSLTWAVWLFWVGILQTLWPVFVPSRRADPKPPSPATAA